MNVQDFLRLKNREKMELIISRNIFKDISSNDLAVILCKERDFNVFHKIAESISYNEDVFSLFIIVPLIQKLNDQSILLEKKFIFVSLITAILIRRKNLEKRKQEKDTYFHVLRDLKNPILKAYSILSDTQCEIFTTEEVRSIFNNTSEIILFSLKASERKELVVNAIELLKSIPSTSPTHYTQSGTLWEFENKYPSPAPFEFHLANTLESTYEKQEYYKTIKMVLILDEILTSNGFPSESSLMVKQSLPDLYKKFIEVEGSLYGSIAEYRDHAFHSFHVFLIGLLFLSLNHEFTRSRGYGHGDSILCWTLTAFFHDISYGIQEIAKISQSVKEQFEGYGEVKHATFNISESVRLYGENIIELFNKLWLKTEEKTIYPFEFYSTLLESWEKRNHGIVSAIIFLKKIDEYLSKHSEFRKSFNLIRWGNIFLRAGLASSIHTLPKDRYWKINVDKRLYDPTNFPFSEQPNLHAFILALIDSIEYLNRPRSKTSEKSIGLDTEKDIHLNLNISCSFTEKRYFQIDILAEYDNKTYEDLFKLGHVIYQLLQHFYSSQWGVRIVLSTKRGWGEWDTLKDPRSVCDDIQIENNLLLQMKDHSILPLKPEIHLLLQRAELEYFRENFESNLEEYIGQEKLLYSAMFKKVFFQLNVHNTKNLRPITKDYEILSKRHHIAASNDKEIDKMIEQFFYYEEIDKILPKNVSIQIENFLQKQLLK